MVFHLAWQLPNCCIVRVTLDSMAAIDRAPLLNSGSIPAELSSPLPMTAELPAANDADPECPPTATPPPPSTELPLFPIVGIAASAGGLGAFIELIRQLPLDTGMAFVLIQHLSPDHESLLTEILSRATVLPVQQAADQMRVAPNQIYVIPPNTQMTLVAGSLHLAPRQKSEGVYHPADVFFESLASDRGNQAIGVVLSGMDGDGAQGIKAIKVAGGITFAQCAATAQFSSMPDTAVATGNVDFVLPPETIALELSNLSRSPFLVRSARLDLSQSPLPEAGDPLAQIFALLRTHTGVDFAQYKPSTLDRRIQRRMMLYKLSSLADYAQYLPTHPDEIQALYEEILIHVTRFFRDPEVFAQLPTQVLPLICQPKPVDEPLRIWVAGCSTGEEAYTIAISLLEFFSDRPHPPPIQIFATDVSEQAIRKARAGFFLETQMEGVSAERKQRFFVTQAGGGYQICSSIRELCVFARHNLGGDPPFSNLDLISCRNVLIYLADPLQERIMALFHYSLKATGLLLLGTSESIKTAANLFAPLDETHKIYTRQPTTTRSLFAFTPSLPPLTRTDPLPSPAASLPTSVDLAHAIDQLIASRYAPLSILVDAQMQIVQMRGDLDPYLKLPSGTTELNLLAMARPGFAAPLRTAIYQAQTQNSLVRQEDVQLETGARSRLVLEVLPVRPALTSARYFLVLLTVLSPTATLPDSALMATLEPADLERELVQLRQALAAATQRELSAQAHLQAVIHEQTQLNQNLRVANEEILSSNEELQSTNEELQTAKEEIQAANEELSTTNDELCSRNLQQNRDNSDLNNFIASINIPIVMLTNDLRIRRFTPTAQRLFNFIATDVGRPFTDLHGNFEISQLEPLILEVLETLNTKEQEIQTIAGYWYSLRIRPYRTTENQIDGVTLVFLDIHLLKSHAATLEAARNYAETIIETVQIPLLVLAADLRVHTANRAFYQTFQLLDTDIMQRGLLEVGAGHWDLLPLQAQLADLLLYDRPVEDWEIQYERSAIAPQTILISAHKLPQGDNGDMILMSLEDITDRKQFETERSHLLAQEQAARQQAEAANHAKDEFLSNLSHELRNPLSAMLGWVQLLQKRDCDAATQARGLAAIAQSASIQNQLIADILDVSRIASGKLRLNHRLLDLGSVVQAAIDSVHLSATAKTIQFVTALQSLMVWGDSDRLQQVCWNLFSNAIKFTPAGGQVSVLLDAVRDEAGAAFAQITVTDTGKGIEPGALPQIFGRFYQADASTTKANQGLGLGLAIVQHLVELHSGTVQATSAGLDQGTTLIVRLPLADAVSPAPALPAEPTSVPALLPDLTGLRLLVVDDQMEMVKLLRVVLTSYGATVQTVMTARAAIAALDDNPGSYDVLISDIGLPEADGYWLMQQVRSRAADRDGQIPAIALTGYATADDQQRVLRAGFQLHLAKPFDVEELGVMVHRLLRRS